MLRSSSKPYVCWRCLTVKTPLSPVASGSRFAPQLQQGSSDISRRSYAGARYKYGGGGGGGGGGRRRGGPSTSASGQELAHIRGKSDIRERLREWESMNHEPSRRLLQDMPVQDTPLSNYLTRPDLLPGATDALGGEESELQRNSKKNRALFEADELADLRGATSALVAGDLVETRYGSGRLPVLAVCLGRHHGLQYFYMSTGEVVPERNIPTLFTLTNFIDPAKLQPLVAILPKEPVTKPRNVLFHKHNPAALKTASRLQGELIKFYQDSVSFYQSHLTLDTASSFLAHPEKPLYLNLEELADKLLPEYLKQDGRFLPHALYAAHTALQRDEWGFRPLNMRWHRRNYIYEVRPVSDIRILRKVENQVRELVEGAALRENPSESLSLLRQNSLGSFILKARGVIQANRLRREWTPHGMIGPSNEKVDNLALWTKQEVDYIRFMELWACHRIVPKASQLESLGSTILRLTDVYNDADWLAHWTGFTFLQEIGWIPPWEIPARYEYKFPDAKVQRGADMVMPLVDVNGSLRPDIAEGHRRDWGETTVFCVDSEQTTDVDDGFSIEAAENPGEHWIHIHIADPASRIDPKSDLARQLEKAPSSLYLAGFPNKMLPRDLEQQFSLDPGQPALTFSAKVNDQGEILDYKVEPGTLQKVLHVPKNEVAAVLPGLQPRPPSAADTFAVGKPPAPSQPVKRITTAADLSQKDKDDLLVLDKLCTALKNRRVEKGQLPQFQSRFSSPEVSLDAVVVKGDPDVLDSSMAWQGDPFIKFAHPHPTPADRLVERLMHTAGEVAAKWCQARNIPVPYSTQPEALRNLAELSAFRRTHIEPLTARGEPVPVDILHGLFALVGTSELSAAPAPFYSVGLDAYAKSSSPLRRFGDLVVHWQIHAALARERETGRSLAGQDCSEASDFLPWTYRTLAPALPVLQALQRQIKQVDNRDGPTQWVAQALLRAWRFGEAPLPERFTFVVDGLYPFGLRGRLENFYDLSASVDLSRLGSVARLADVQVDDRFEVEIANINVVTTQISVQPLRKLETESKDEPGHADAAPRDAAATPA
ncbi:mitochondrial protein cyt-4 [Colletotrichum tofieldiae]|nr:mitochondrial protein cyt-4 [Colletotrichum tofieldiae]GKT75382.1 mitochondrial protein cyt-4 [Colletotrichum tofieldiae]